MARFRASAVDAAPAPAIVSRVTRSIALDDATIRRLERHETLAHALGEREMRDLGDALVLLDPRDPDPFWNRMISVRWPSEPAAFDRRLTEAMALFALARRVPHIWPSPAWNEPPDLVARLVAHGFHDVGGGHVMVLVGPDQAPPISAAELAPEVTITRIARRSDAASGDLEAVSVVLAQAFGALPERTGELAADLHRTLADPRVALVLARVAGEPAAAAKATTFDDLTYLSSIGTRPRFQGRGLGALVSREAIAVGRELGSAMTYLGVFSGNDPAIRMYDRLGFASAGEAPDLLLE